MKKGRCKTFLFCITTLNTGGFPCLVQAVLSFLSYVDPGSETRPCVTAASVQGWNAPEPGLSPYE